MGLSDKDTIETAALGRPFQLGMLYDCRKDALIQGGTLWDQNQLQKNRIVQQQNITELKVTTSDLIEDKSDSLKISGSLRLSLLGGLLNVEGSAKYFQDHQSQQARVTLQYKATTKFEQLSMSDLAHEKISHPDVFEDDSATHVVTAILYGAGAYFVFDHQSSLKDDKKQVEREVKLFTDKLKVLAANAAASLSMDEQEKAAVEKFSCTFHGDFKLPSNPTSFSEAVSVYRNLPNMLGENGEQAVPVRVWLYPLVKLDSKAATLQRDISTALITRSSEVIESLNHTEIKCSAFLEDEAATTFLFMEKQVQDLIQMCHQYKLDFIQKLGSVIPSIRGGGKEESALVDILDAHDKSPFNSKDLDEWLQTKGKELHMLKSIRKQMVKLDVKMDEDLDDLLFDPDIKNVVCFSFPSVDQLDSFLIKTSNHLKPAAVKDTSGESSEAPNIYCPSSDTRQTIRKQLELFRELKKLSNSDDTKFTAASKYDGSHPGVCILIYEDGSDNAIYFVPPSKPATPTATPVSHDSITVRETEADSATVEYRVEYRRKEKEDSEWASHPLEKNQDAATLSGLKPDIEYEIRATAVGKLSYTVSSDVCTAVILTTVGPPTDVKQTQVKTNSVTLTWNLPSVQHCESFKGYIIEFKEDNGHRWQSRKTEEVYTFTLRDLKQNTEYSIKMRTDVGIGVSLPGEEFTIKTKKHQVDEKQLTLLSPDPPVYGLKLKAAGNVQFNKKVFGSPPTNNPSNKTIMVVGATGSGKTTLINGMINYVLGVEWEDKCRFKLINEETNKTQACSQTSEVTAYQIYHTDGFQVPYSLTIIDTPGFGDTRGIKEDQKITDKIREFFSVKGGIDSIDAVCFVVQSALARLTHTQKYIFDAILSIFGKDIANNIVALVTFADGKSPPVLEAIKEAQIPCATNEDKSILHFKFNNSVLFAKNTGAKVDENNFDQMFWKMGIASMKTFFNHLTNMKDQSLTLTKEVLQERKELEAVVIGVQPMIRKGLSKLEEINTTKAALQNHETHMKENEDFEYEVEVDKSDKIDIPSGQFITNCHGCNYTCHYPCCISNDDGKKGCAAMSNGNCRVCPGKCVWSVHFNMTYRWDTKRVKEKRTYKELKSKYEAALGEKMNSEKMVKHLEIEYEQVQGKVVKMMETLTKCLQHLREIALRPDPLATPDYIDLLIQSEEQEAKPGFKQRIAELQSVRERAVLLTKLAEGVPLTGPEKSTLDKMKSAVKGIFNNARHWFKTSR